MSSRSYRLPKIKERRPPPSFTHIPQLDGHDAHLRHPSSPRVYCCIHVLHAPWPRVSFHHGSKIIRINTDLCCRGTSGSSFDGTPGSCNGQVVQTASPNAVLDNLDVGAMPECLPEQEALLPSPGVTISRRHPYDKYCTTTLFQTPYNQMNETCKNVVVSVLVVATFLTGFTAYGCYRCICRYTRRLLSPSDPERGRHGETHSMHVIVPNTIGTSSPQPNPDSNCPPPQSDTSIVVTAPTENVASPTKPSNPPNRNNLLPDSDASSIRSGASDVSDTGSVSSQGSTAPLLPGHGRSSMRQYPPHSEHPKRDVRAVEKPEWEWDLDE